MNANRWISQLALVLIFSSCPVMAEVPAKPVPDIIVVRVEARFIDVVEGLTSAIQGRGFSIAHVVSAKEILAASQAEYGGEKAVYQAARTLAFCSARLSHQLVAENPEFLVLCPFSLSIYQLPEKPGEVVIAYRNPMSLKPAKHSEALQAVSKMFQALVKDATVWFPRR